MNSSTPEMPDSTNGNGTGKRPEVRCAVRFPLSLPLVLFNENKEFSAVTRNVSASGIYFVIDHQIKPGEIIGFSLRMPGAVLGTQKDVTVQCRGRVVRSSAEESGFHTAATIDEYEFSQE